VYAEPDCEAAIAAYVGRVHAEARNETKLVHLDLATGRPLPVKGGHGVDWTDGIHDQVYPWSKESILQEVAATFDNELRHSKYGTNDAQFRLDLSAMIEAGELATKFEPPPRTAAKLRSPSIIVTDSEKMLHFFNRPVVLSVIGEALQRHALSPLLPLCSVQDLDPISCRIENQPLEWGSEDLPCVSVYNPLPAALAEKPDVWRRPLSAYTCVQRRLPKGFRLVNGKYELMQHGDCICRFVLHPEGQFEYWQSRAFRDEDEEKYAEKGSGQSAGLWTVGPGGVLTLEGAFHHVTSKLERVKEKLNFSLEWLAQSWTVVPEDDALKLVRPSALQALERATWPTVRPGTYTYAQISHDLGPNHGHVRGVFQEDIKIVLSLYDTGWYEFTEERRLHRARKQTTAAVHLGRRWEMDPELRVVRLSAPTKQALRMRRYTTGTEFEDLWVAAVEIPLARLEAEFAFYPFEGGNYPETVAAPFEVKPHCDLTCTPASSAPFPRRRKMLGGMEWQNHNPSTLGASFSRYSDTGSSWRKSPWARSMADPRLSFRKSESLSRTGASASNPNFASQRSERTGSSQRSGR
jgi:hypothetical protein